MKRLKISLSMLIVSLVMVMPALAGDYDLVINNGRVIDPETLFDGVANVGIKDGRIAEISKKPLKGDRDDRCHRQNRGTGLYRHPFPLSNADRLFPRVARRVDQQHGFRDGLCGILYGGLVQGT